MSERMTNAEALNEVANLDAVQSAALGVTPQVQQVAAAAANGNARAIAAFTEPYTPLYNAFVGLISKLVVVRLNNARYFDVYERHHKGLLHGRPELGYMYPASHGTGNESAVLKTSPGRGSLSTVVTADAPKLLTINGIIPFSYARRVAISPTQVADAFANEYGIDDLIVKSTQSVDNAITEDENGGLDSALLNTAHHLVPVGAGTAIEANAKSAVYDLVPTTADDKSALTQHRYNDLSDAFLQAMYTKIQEACFAMLGRPSIAYTAMGVPNNTEGSNMVCYIDANVYAQMNSRIASMAKNIERLETQGVSIKPMQAPYFGLNLTTTEAPTTTGATVVALMGSADFVTDYLLSDYERTLPTDRGDIHSRVVDGEIAVAPYEVFSYIVAGEVNPSVYGITNITDTAVVPDSGTNPCCVLFTSAGGSAETICPGEAKYYSITDFDSTVVNVRPFTGLRFNLYFNGVLILSNLTERIDAVDYMSTYGPGTYAMEWSNA